MKYDRLSRRHFLEGVGAALALPLLPSLLDRAEAQSVTPPRFFVAHWVPHGGLSIENATPIHSTVSLTEHTLFPAMGSEPAHVARWGELRSLKRTYAQTAAARTQAIIDDDDGAARVSPLIGSFVEDALLDKMTVLRGIDFLTYGGHTRGFLGNFVNRDGGADEGLANVSVPTLDAVLASSPKFYSAADRALLKVPSLESSWWELSSFRNGASVSRNPYTAFSNQELYSRFFSSVQATPGKKVDPRVALVDRVYEDYARLTKGASGPGRRLSTDDRLRLNEYLDNTKTIADRMRAEVTAGCTPPTLAPDQRNELVRGEYNWSGVTGSPAQLQRAALELRNLMLVNAFLCGSTRLAVLGTFPLIGPWSPSTFNTPSQLEADRTDSHGMLFHNHDLPDRQQFLLRQQRFFFQYGYLDLVRRMNAVTVLPGKTMLDQALVYWSSESGHSTHSAKNVPTIIAGSGAGYFKTGRYVDYLNRERVIRGQWGNTWTAGMPQNQLLANFAQAMGLSREDYELSDAAYGTKFPQRGGRVPGYGDPAMPVFNNSVPYLPQVLAQMSDKLPLL